MDKKVVVVPAEAEAVRTIFERYLALGSIRALAADLDRRGIRSKPRRLSTGRSIGGGSFGVGALAYLLKNRFYVGEVVYRREVNRGDHAPILGRDLFEAVQGKLAAQAVERRCRLRGSPAVLSGRLFDDRGNRMSPEPYQQGWRPLPLLRLPGGAAKKACSWSNRSRASRRDRDADQRGGAQAPAGERHRGRRW
ncbi:MAG: recombinase family protein [Hyphomicrobium sp.]